MKNPEAFGCGDLDNSSRQFFYKLKLNFGGFIIAQEARKILMYHLLE